MIEFPEPVEIEFRDGQRAIPAYLAALMTGLETHTMTYEEAVRAANQRAMGNFLNEAQDKIIELHFQEKR